MVMSNSPLLSKSPNIFLFKETFHMMFFQFSDSCQAVNRISSEPTYTFCDNQVDFSVQSIRNHGIKALSMFRRCCTYSFICIYFNKFPIRISLNVIGIVRNLCLIAGELFLKIGGNSGVGSDFSASWNGCGLPSCPINRRRNDGYFLAFSAPFCGILSHLRCPAFTARMILPKNGGFRIIFEKKSQLVRRYENVFNFAFHNFHVKFFNLQSKANLFIQNPFGNLLCRRAV